MGFFRNLGENFPYTNFHDLNLDWIIAKVKQDITGMNEVTQKVDEFQAYIDNIDGEIQEHIEETIPGAVQTAIDEGIFDQVLEASRVRRYVFFGDSYGEGYSPDGNVTGYPNLIKTQLGLSNDNCYIFNKGGARFGISSGSEYAFDTVIADSVASITNPETITDIIIAGGYNDNGNSYVNINEGIARCKTVINTYFTNPSLRIHLFAIGYNCSSPAVRSSLHNIYTYCYARSGWAFHRLTPAIYAQSLWSTDGYHPLSAGQEIIAKNIENILMGGTSISKPTTIEYANSNITNVILWTRSFDDYFVSELYMGTNITVNNITLNNTTPVKILEIESSCPLANNADATTRRIANVQGIAKMSDNTFRDIHLVLYLDQTDRTTYSLMACIYNLNDDNTNFMTLSNVTEIMLYNNSIQFIIPFEF